MTHAAATQFVNFPVAPIAIILRNRGDIIAHYHHFEMTICNHEWQNKRVRISIMSLRDFKGMELYTRSFLENLLSRLFNKIYY